MVPILANAISSAASLHSSMASSPQLCHKELGGDNRLLHPSPARFQISWQGRYHPLFLRHRGKAGQTSAMLSNFNISEARAIPERGEIDVTFRKHASWNPIFPLDPLIEVVDVDILRLHPGSHRSPLLRQSWEVLQVLIGDLRKRMPAMSTSSVAALR